MEKSNRFTHIYGYIVCLISVVTFLICVTNFVNAFIDKTDPLHSEYFGNSSSTLASFEIYKLDQMKSLQSKEGNLKNALPDDQALRKIYETTRQDKIDQITFRSNRTIIVCGLLIAICAVLFLTHWRLARKSIRQADL